VFQCLGAWVENVAFLQIVANARRTYRFQEREARNGEGCGGANQGCDIRILVLACGDNGTDNLYFVIEILGKQRADGAVDQTGNQRFLLGGTSFTLEETSGDLARGVGFFLVIHCQREKVCAGFDLLFAYCCRQYLGGSHGDDYGCCCLSCNLSCFQCHGVITVLEGLPHYIEHTRFLYFYFDPGTIAMTSMSIEGLGPQLAEAPLLSSHLELFTGQSATQTQLLDQGGVAICTLALQIVEQLATAVYHADQTTTGVVV